MKRATLFLSLVLSASVASGVAVAGPKQHGHKQLNAVLQQLDLSISQKQDIRQAFREGRQNMHMYREDMQDVREQMKSLVQSDDWQPEAVAAVIEQRSELMEQLALNRAQKKHLVWNLLTDEQQQKLDELMDPKNREGREFDGLQKIQSLGLSAEQQAEFDLIKANIEQTKAEFTSLMASHKAAEKALIQADEFDQAAWQALVDGQQENFTTIALTMAQGRHQIWNLLTEEQRETMLSFKKERRGKRKGKGEGRPFI